MNALVQKLSDEVEQVLPESLVEAKAEAVRAKLQEQGTQLVLAYRNPVAQQKAEALREAMEEAAAQRPDPTRSILDSGKADREWLDLGSGSSSCSSGTGSCSSLSELVGVTTTSIVSQNWIRCAWKFRSRDGAFWEPEDSKGVEWKSLKIARSPTTRLLHSRQLQ